MNSTNLETFFNSTLNRTVHLIETWEYVWHHSKAPSTYHAPDQETNTLNNNKNNTKKAAKKKSRAPQHPQKDINDEELPSVRELRSKHKNDLSWC